MKANVNITTIYINFWKDLSALSLSAHMIGELKQLSTNIKYATTLYHKFTYKEYVPEPGKEYLEMLNLLKAKIWAQGLQLQPTQKKGITYRYFKEMCMLLNQEIKRISSLVQEPREIKSEPEKEPEVKEYSGLMVNHLDNLTSKETYTLVEETKDKKIFIGKKWGHKVFYTRDPEIGWIEICFCSYMEHPIKF